MKRRVLGAVAALLLAALGAVLLVSYVGAADERAMAGMKTETVLVVAKPIAQGAAADQLGSQVEAKVLPAVAVAADAVADLSELAGLVTTTDLKAGEQLLTSRFADPAIVIKPGEVAIPKGLQQMSLSLDPQRVVGGHLTPGVLVGVFISLPKDDLGPAQTHLTLNQVLVTRVEGGTASAPTVGKSTSTASGNAVMVTLAVTAAQAEKVVFGAENGTLWLSLEPAAAVVTDTRVITRKNVDQ